MPTRHALRLLACLLGLALAVPVPASAAAPRELAGGAIARGVLPPARAPLAQPDSLIVQYRQGTSAARRLAVRAAERLAPVRSVAMARVDVVRPQGRSLDEALADLRAQPEVEVVSINHRRELFDDPTVEEFWGFQWGHHNTGQVINGFLGVPDADVDGLQAMAASIDASSVVVAVTDDGVDFSHPDLAGRAWVNPGESGLDTGGLAKESNGVDDDLNGFVDDVNGWDFCHGDNTVHDIGEDYHGTAVAGAIAASLNGQGVVGVAPTARIMGVKWLVPEVGCNTDDLAIAAIQYAAGFGVPIINASWGGSGFNPLMESAIANSGALFVAAAGNGGPDGVGDNIDVAPDYPASFGSPNILSVASIQNEGGLSLFSNYGTGSVDLAAPGEDVALAFPVGEAFCPEGWCLLSGTSFAAPYVAGIAALAGAANPALLASPLQLRARVMASAVPRAALVGRTASGRLANAHGVVDSSPPVAGGKPIPLPLVVSQLGTGSAGNFRLRLTWPAGTDDGDELSYGIERRRSGGAWSLIGNGLSARQVDISIPPSGLNEFRIRPTDAGGNPAAGFSPIAAFTPVLYQETSTLVRRTGTWRTASSSFSSGGKTRYTTGSGASMTLTFTGRVVAFVAPRGPTRSNFKVYVDGKYIRTVSLYNATTQSRQVLFTTGWLASGRHTLKLVNTRVGSRTRGEIDGFIVLR